MNQKVILTREEKKLLATEVLRYWNFNDFTMTNLQDIATKVKLPVTLLETMALHYENLLSLETLQDKLIFKGGTAVQHYLDPMNQRGSVDLDFNTELGHPATIKQAINKINEKLEAEEGIRNLHGVSFGAYEFDYEDPKSGTLTFTRLLPTKVNEFIKVGNTIIQGKKMKVQINYKHAWLPALKTISVEPKLLPHNYLRTAKSITVQIASVGDLICDKLLTITQVGNFGRERIKDIYDLVMLTRVEEREKFAVAEKKITAIAQAEGLKKDEMIRSALEHLEQMKRVTSTVIGFKSQVAKKGWKMVEDWENSLEESIATIEREVLRKNKE